MAAQEGTWDVTTRLQYTAFRQLQPHCVLKVYHQLHCRPEHRDLGILQVARQHATRVISFGCVNYQMLSDQAWLMEDLPEQMTYKRSFSLFKDGHCVEMLLDDDPEVINDKIARWFDGPNYKERVSAVKGIGQGNFAAGIPPKSTVGGNMFGSFETSGSQYMRWKPTFGSPGASGSRGLFPPPRAGGHVPPSYRVPVYRVTPDEKRTQRERDSAKRQTIMNVQTPPHGPRAVLQELVNPSTTEAAAAAPRPQQQYPMEMLYGFDPEQQQQVLWPPVQMPHGTLLSELRMERVDDFEELLAGTQEEEEEAQERGSPDEELARNPAPK